MNISPNVVSIPMLSQTNNVATDRLANENAVKSSIMATQAPFGSVANREVKKEKRNKGANWQDEESEYTTGDEVKHSAADATLNNRWAELISLMVGYNYSTIRTKDYTIRFRLSKKLLDAAVAQYQDSSKMRHHFVVQYRYLFAVTPNPPSRIITKL